MAPCKTYAWAIVRPAFQARLNVTEKNSCVSYAVGYIQVFRDFGIVRFALCSAAANCVCAGCVHGECGYVL